MERIDFANDFIYQALEKLLNISQDVHMNDEQRQAIYDVIEDIEEARHALYELKNEMRIQRA
ncbi:hypothetical protein NMU03_10020 [Allocoprobacillus halotolerans]|uniref:Uncharacterized protein n=1 Tax=Allocoprobacillus halotolerans TaxID=2944914 RepID=A0ABY5HY84_9FIRM|nr:hypothetical protein [Allocoprobacillus halotolerans]UTY38033.1 hypothetical protein NMU03_10020 [Allocoprobacillus halotolerans]